MPIFDLVLLGLLGIFIIYGFYLGLVRMILNLVSTILAIIISLNIYLYLSEILSFINFISEIWIKITSFVIVLIIVNYLLGIVFKFIGKILHLISSLPVISFMNRSLGGLLGLIQGLFLLGIIIYVSSRYAPMNDFLSSIMVGSDLAPILMRGVNWASPLVPDALKFLESVII
ncbi:MAG: CvpA family protein [Patescibacteria group bacterium]|nr:CvpA family protein [Patescibacteria group bacterium]